MNLKTDKVNSMNSDRLHVASLSRASWYTTVLLLCLHIGSFYGVRV